MPNPTGGPNQLSAAEWKVLLASVQKPELVIAMGYGGKVDSDTYPRLAPCDDDKDYYIKGRISGRPDVDRSLVSEHVVGRIGKVISAPVPNVKLVVLSEELIRLNTEFHPLLPGMCHGSEFVENLSGKTKAVESFDPPENRSRWASLAILYGLCVPWDRQYFYDSREPYPVWSLDHGQFFPNGPNWDVTSFDLREHLDPPVADFQITVPCNLSDEECRDAAHQLHLLTDAVIADIIGAPPDEWNFTTPERIAMAIFLAYRRDKILLIYGVADGT